MAKTTNNTNFKSRLAKARRESKASIQNRRLRSDIAINDTLKRESIATMTTLLNSVYDALELDSEQLSRKLKVVRRSEYGRVPGMVNILSTTYAWPISQGGDASTIDSQQELLLDTLASAGVMIDKDLLLDIKESKGFHSFITDEAEIVDAEEPLFEEYGYYVETFAESAGLPFIDLKLNEDAWDRAESKAKAKAGADKALAEEALARHKELIAS